MTKYYKTFIIAFSVVASGFISTSAESSNIFRRKQTQQRIDNRITSQALPNGLDGRCYPTCLKNICVPNFNSASHYDAITWCKNNCINSRRARASVTSNDYPQNICKGILPPWENSKEKWERLKAQFLGANTNIDVYNRERKRVGGEIGSRKRIGRAVKRTGQGLAMGGFSGASSAATCKMCQDAKQVCPDTSGALSSKIKNKRMICREECFAMPWLRKNTTFQPDDQASMKENLKENMNIYIDGLCDGNLSIQQGFAGMSSNIAAEMQSSVQGSNTASSSPQANLPVTFPPQPEPAYGQDSEGNLDANNNNMAAMMNRLSGQNPRPSASVQMSIQQQQDQTRLNRIRQEQQIYRNRQRDLATFGGAARTNQGISQLPNTQAGALNDGSSGRNNPYTSRPLPPLPQDQSYVPSAPRMSNQMQSQRQGVDPRRNSTGTMSPGRQLPPAYQPPLAPSRNSQASAPQYQRPQPAWMK